jgi:hypothetical protein
LGCKIIIVYSHNRWQNDTDKGKPDSRRVLEQSGDSGEDNDENISYMNGIMDNKFHLEIFVVDGFQILILLMNYVKNKNLILMENTESVLLH